MANWIPVCYALTGSKEELLDIESKIRKDEGAVEWKRTDDGEEYLLWCFLNKHWENPEMRELIEGAYKTVKIFYEAPAGDTNDKEERYFVPRIKLINVDGLNFCLNNDGTAMLNCDDCIKGKVLNVPEQIELNGKTYMVTSFGDAFADPQYGSRTIAPQELEEVFLPATIKEVTAYCTSPSTLKAIHFAGDINSIGEYAFDGCKQLATVEFAGKVNTIEYMAFADTDIKDIQVPDGTTVDPDAFFGSPYGEKVKSS